MATINGTLKYKQDDGTLVALGPVGVDERARTLATSAGQTANNAQTAATDAQNTADTALKYIGNWPYPDQTDTITTSVNTLNTRVSALESAGQPILVPIVGNVISTMTIPAGANIIIDVFPTIDYEKAIVENLPINNNVSIVKAETVKLVTPDGSTINAIDVTPTFADGYPRVTAVIDSLPSSIVNKAIVFASGAYIKFDY